MPPPPNDLNAPAIAFLTLSAVFLLLLMVIWYRYLLWFRRKNMRGKGTEKDLGPEVAGTTPEVPGGGGGIPPGAPGDGPQVGVGGGGPEIVQPGAPQQQAPGSRGGSRRGRSPGGGTWRGGRGGGGGDWRGDERRDGRGNGRGEGRGNGSRNGDGEGRAGGRELPEWIQAGWDFGELDDQRLPGEQRREGSRGGRDFEPRTDGRGSSVRGGGRRVSFAGGGTDFEPREARHHRIHRRPEDMPRTESRDRRRPWDQYSDSEIERRERPERYRIWPRNGNIEPQRGENRRKTRGRSEQDDDFERSGARKGQDREEGDWFRGRRSLVTEVRPETRTDDESRYQRNGAGSIDLERRSHDSRERIDQNIEEVPRTWGGSDGGHSKRGDEDAFSGPIYGPHREGSPQRSGANGT